MLRKWASPGPLLLIRHSTISCNSSSGRVIKGGRGRETSYEATGFKRCSSMVILSKFCTGFARLAADCRGRFRGREDLISYSSSSRDVGDDTRPLWALPLC